MEKKHYMMPCTEVLAISADVWMEFSGSNTPTQPTAPERRDPSF